MTRLKDLVHRSALRNRSAGETEVGSSAQTFEQTDFTIPAGTDWSAGHELATFAVTSPLFIAGLWVAIEAPLFAEDDVRLRIGQTFIQPFPNNPGLKDGIVATSPLNAFFADDEPRPFVLDIWTSGVTTEPIDVVSVYASFQSI